MPKQKPQQVEAIKERNRKTATARKIELYSSAYGLAREQISTTLKRERSDIALRIHASIQRQLKAGETDPRVIASEAVKDALGV